MNSEPTKLPPPLHSEAATGSQHVSGSATIQIIPAKKAAGQRRILFTGDGKPNSTICNLCDPPGTFAGATDVGKVPCNVRDFKDDIFTLWRCTGCGSIHCAEDADLPKYYANYPLKNQTLTFHERVGYSNRLRLLKRQGLRRTDRILDFGCGAGLFVDFLREKGFPNVFGYDAFVPAYSDPTRLQVTYDAVVSYDVIEHDDDPRAFMERLSRLVRSGGLLVIGTPRAEGVSIGRHGDPQLHPPYHRHILSEKVLLALGQEHRLELTHLYRRSFYDALLPTVNSHFMWRYIQKSGGLLDSAVEPPQIGLVWRSPDLLFLALFGYFMPLGDNMLLTFRKRTPMGVPMNSELSNLPPTVPSDAALGSQNAGGSATIQIIPAKKAARRRRILFMAEGITMTHFVRPAYLAETLDPSEWEIHFWTPERYHPLLRRSFERVGDLRTIDPHDFLNNMAHGRVMYSAQALNDYVQQDLEIIRKVQPDLVIGDFRLSLAVSAPLARVPFASIFNAHWSPAYKRPAVVNELPMTQWVSPRLLAYALPVVQPIIEALHAKPINDTRRAYGLPNLSKSLSHIYTAGDLVLYPDVPGFVPLQNLPAHHHFIGICPWSSPEVLPPWWNKVMDSPRPKIFVSLGSSGPVKAVPAVLEAASGLPVEVLLSTSGRSVVSAYHRDVHMADLLPYEETAKRSAIVVSHGGTGGLYPALAGGAPMLAIPSNYDTHLSTDRLVKLGVGLRVRAEEATPVNIRRALKELLEKPQYKQAAKEWSHRIAAVDTKTLFPSLLRQWFSARSAGKVMA